MNRNRRELLAGLGAASASTLLWAFGCGGAQRRAAARARARADLRPLLHEAVARLAPHFSSVHVLAVSRRRTTAAVDVLGTGLAHGLRDGIVLAVRDKTGQQLEQVTHTLDAEGLATAVRALIGSSKQLASLAWPASPPAPQPDPPPDARLLDRALELARADRLDSRLVYAAAVVDLDDVRVWSVSPTHEHEQRALRFRERVVRTAWSGPRPIVGEASRAWSGALGDDGLDAATLAATTRRALELMTPGAFEDGARTVLLEPRLTAALVDALARTALTTARPPALQRRFAVGATLGAAGLVLADDPTARGVYGGYTFDDEGELAQRVTLVDGGRITAVLGRGRARRPGHVGAIERAPSHLVLAHGTTPYRSLREDGVLLEGTTSVAVDPGTGRVVLGADRAREIAKGQETGRVYPDVELVGDVGELLAAVTGVSAETTIVGYRDELGDGEPRWRSVEAPWLRLSGHVRARRRLA